MDIEQLLVTTLGPFVGGRIFPNTFMQGDALPNWPAIRYNLSGNTNPSACGSLGDDNDEVTVQIDIVDKTYALAKALRKSVIDALVATDPPCQRQFDFRTYDAETKTHRAVLTYLFQLTADSP